MRAVSSWLRHWYEKALFTSAEIKREQRVSETFNNLGKEFSCFNTEGNCIGNVVGLTVILADGVDFPFISFVWCC